MPQLELIDFANVNPADLHEIVSAPENAGLEVDFPRLPNRYGTLEKAEVSVVQISERVRLGMGRFAVYGVALDGVMSGVITAEQAELSVRRGLHS